jgi:hypothetical protein
MDPLDHWQASPIQFVTASSNELGADVAIQARDAKHPVGSIMIAGP